MTVQGAVPRSAAQGHRRVAVGLRLLAVLGLVVDVYVHLRLAPLYDALGTQVTQGALFRLEAALAGAAAVAVTLSDGRRAWTAAGGVAVAGLVAVLVTRYVDVPAIGPLPDMYDPQWSPDKVVVTLGMLATVTAWAVRETLRARRG